MSIIRILYCLVWWGLSASVLADSFDDAVSVYLKGFDQCSNAKAALADNDLPKAQRAFADYEATKKQAAGIDKNILNSSKRAMDSNLKYCGRVGSDIELALGKPLLDKALADCDKAFEAFKTDQPDAAGQYFQQYVQQRDVALQAAPVLESVFSLKSDIRRCDRLENKITHAGEQQAVLVQLLDSAKEESESFATYCASTRKEFRDAEFGSQAIQVGEKAVAKTENYRKSAAEFYARLKAKQPTGDKTIESQLKNGDACLAGFRGEVAEQKRKYSTVAAELKSQTGILASANKNCTSIAALSAQGPDKKRYTQASAQYEAARKSRDGVKRTLSANAIYGANPDGADAKDVNTQMKDLNRCLELARSQVATLMPVVSVAPPPTLQPAKPVAAIPSPVKNIASTIPALKLEGVLSMTGVVPEFVVIYWDDGKQGESDSDAEIFSTGFNKKFYILPKDGSLMVRNGDFATHKLSVTNELQNLDDKLASISSRQKRTVQIRIPQNTIAMLRSNNARVTPSYVVNAVSSSLVTLNFADDSRELPVELSNPASAKKGYLLVPDADPLEFELASGEEKMLNMTRNNVVVGTLTLRGL